MMELRNDLPEWAIKQQITKEDWQFYWTNQNARSGYDCGFRPETDDDSTFYASYLRSVRWKRFRAVVLILAGGRCADCGENAEHVHHLTYARLGNERLEDVVPLCRFCHENRHGGPLGAFIARIIRRIESSDEQRPA